MKQKKRKNKNAKARKSMPRTAQPHHKLTLETLKISACTIVKNEAKNIEKWLASVRPVADEIIVVDTGSTDNTVELAKKGGAKVYSFPWKKDFSAAKNFALDQAHGHWILFLDADEYFTEESLPYLRPIAVGLEEDDRFVGVSCRMINIDVDRDNRVLTAFTQTRMFKHRPWLRYIGCVHERLNLPQGKYFKIVTGIEIIHTGYSTNVVQAKFARNLELMKERIAQSSDAPEETIMNDRYLLDIYYGQNKLEEAKAAAQRIFHNPIAKGNEEFRFHAHSRYISCLMEEKAYDDVEKAFIDALESCPTRPDFLLMRGTWRYQVGRWLTAEADLVKGIEMEEAQRATAEDEQTEDSIADNGVSRLPYAYWALGALCERKHEWDRAQDAYLAALRVFRYDGSALKALWEFLARIHASDVDAIQILNSIYDADSKTDVEFLAKLLRRLGAGKVYVYYANRAKVDSDTPYYALAAGCPADAAARAVRGLRSFRRLADMALAKGSTRGKEFDTLFGRVSRIEEQQSSSLKVTLPGPKAPEAQA